MLIIFYVIKDIFFWISFLETVMQFLEKLSDKLSERLVFILFVRVCIMFFFFKEDSIYKKLGGDLLRM